MAGMGIGEAAAIGSLVTAAAGTTTSMVMDRNAQNQKARRMKLQQQIDEKKRKNLLEERLAKRRAMIGSMGISANGSVIASQNKIIKDSYGYGGYGNENSDFGYYAGFGNQALGLGSQMLNEANRMVK